MTVGQRRDNLVKLADAIFEIDFAGRILSFGHAATARQAKLNSPFDKPKRMGYFPL